MINVLAKPSIEIQNKITLWLNHLLVLYTFLIPINNNAKSSMFFVMLVLFLYRRDYWKYLKEVLNNRIVQACLLFYFVNLAGMIYTENIDYGKDHMDRVKYLLFPLMFLSFLDVRFAFRIVTAFILGMLVAEIFSYLIHFRIFPYELYIADFEIYQTNLHSPAPFMAHSDHSVGLSLVIAILLYQLLNKDNLNKWVKLGSILFIISATFNMTFIASRTGYILFLLIVFFVILLSYREHIVKALIISLSSLSFIVILAYNYADTVNLRVNYLIDNLNKVVDEQDYSAGSIGARVGFSAYSLKVIQDNLLIGVGTGDHMDEVRKIIAEKHAYLKDPNYMGKPHNVYIQILLQLGVIGFIAFLYFIYTVLSYKNISNYNMDIIRLISFSTLVFMLAGMFFGSFELPLLMVFISAMIVKKEQFIEFHDINSQLILKYLFWIILFLIIGITR